VFKPVLPKKKKKKKRHLSRWSTGRSWEQSYSNFAMITGVFLKHIEGPGVMVYSCNPSTLGWLRQENYEFKVSLS
jgi:hypothetical protein